MAIAPVGCYRQAGFAGDVLAWRDLMQEGHMPPDLDLAALSAVRAAYLRKRRHSADNEFLARVAVLQKIRGYEAVVLWFEHDLLDQLQFLQILDWFVAPGDAYSGPHLI